jgi:HK97 family phage prohead protease
MTRETRTLSRPIELRFAAGEGARTAVGYAAVFNSPTNIGDYFREVIAPGAFRNAINDDVLALRDHDRGRLLGRVGAGTLRLAEDETGLASEIDLPDTTDGRDAAVLIDRGDVKGMSFSFRSLREEWDETTVPLPTRTIFELELYEVTVTACPAYPDTTIAMRSLEAARKERRQQNFTAAAKRVAMKATVDLRARGVTSKA